MGAKSVLILHSGRIGPVQPECSGYVEGVSCLRISLVVLSYNNAAHTINCIQTLLSSLSSALLPLVEVVLVDNGSRAEEHESVMDFLATGLSKQVQVTCETIVQNLGYPGGINAGLARCTGEIIGVLNNDLVFPPGWLEPLVNILERDKAIGFVAPYLSFAASAQNVRRDFDSYEEMCHFSEQFTDGKEMQYTHVDKVIGACILFRRDLLHTVGGIDFWYGIGNYDDDDWCLRVLLAGYKIALASGSFVQHVGHATFRKSEEFVPSLKNNSLKFELKWDVKETSNHKGLLSRSGVVRHSRFDRARHYIPAGPGDYSSPTFPYLKNESERDRVLFCADWTSELSGWKKAFVEAVRSVQNVEIVLWIPSDYFEVSTVVQTISDLIKVANCDVAARSVEFKLLHEPVAHIDTLRVIASAAALVQVPNDFVNLYLVHLSSLTSTKLLRCTAD